MRRSIVVTTAIGILCGAAALLHGGDKPAPGTSGVTIGEMRIQTVPRLTYLFVPAETSFDQMAKPVKAGFDKVFAVVQEAKMLLARPSLLVYQGNPHFHPDKPFSMEIGIVVADGTQVEAGADVKVRQTEAFKCATILYTGPVNRQGEAYQKLIPALRAAGHEPTGEEREMLLYWEGMDSPNNVFIMQIGIK